MTNDSSTRLARATVVAMRAAAGNSAVPSDSPIVILPSMRPNTPLAAEEALMTLAKPVVCVSFSLDGWTFIGTWSVPGPVGLGTDLTDMLQKTFREGGLSHASDGGPDIVVTGRYGISAPLTFAEYERWVNDYHLPLASVTVRPAAAGDPSARFLAIVGPPDQGRLDLLDGQ